MTQIRKLVLVAFALLMAATPLAVNATNQFTSGDINRSQWTYFANKRKISYSPYGIAFNKTDGPAMYMRWYGCGGWTGMGPSIALPNADPTGYYQIGPGQLTNGLVFCMAGLANGNNSSDTFSGYLDWDGVDVAD